MSLKGGETDYQRLRDIKKKGELKGSEDITESLKEI